MIQKKRRNNVLLLSIFEEQKNTGKFTAIKNVWFIVQRVIKFMIIHEKQNQFFNLFIKKKNKNNKIKY